MSSNQRQLATRRKISGTTITSAVDRLKATGVISRKPKRRKTLLQKISCWFKTTQPVMIDAVIWFGTLTLTGGILYYLLLHGWKLSA